MQSYEMVKEEINLLKLNKEEEDAKYWALKKQVDDLEIKYAALQQDNDGLQGQVHAHEKEIFKLKEGIQNTMNQRDEVVREKDKT